MFGFDSRMPYRQEPTSIAIQESRIGSIQLDASPVHDEHGDLGAILALHKGLQTIRHWDWGRLCSHDRLIYYEMHATHFQTYHLGQQAISTRHFLCQEVAADMQNNTFMLLTHLLCDKFAQAAVHIQPGLLEQLWLRLLMRCIQPAGSTDHTPCQEASTAQI